MKKILLSIAAVGLLLGACERAPETILMDEDQACVQTSDEIIPGQYVVVLNPTGLKSRVINFEEAQVTMEGITQKVLASSGISQRVPLQVYSAALEGFAVNLSESEAAELAKSAGVQQLILTHLSRRYREKDILEEAQTVFENTSVARDFDTFNIRKED